MTSVRIIWLTLCLLWVFAEIRLSGKSRPDHQILLHSERRSQKRLWLSLLTGLGLALWLKYLAWLPIPIGYLPRQLLALPLFLAGLAIRYQAIRQLGRFFTTNVTIQKQHSLITEGLYRRIRHPAYSGLLLALLAAGLAMGDGLALFGLAIPSFWALKTRIDIEEQMLQQTFGENYLRYRQRSWKLLPWLF